MDGGLQPLHDALAQTLAPDPASWLIAPPQGQGMQCRVSYCATNITSAHIAVGHTAQALIKQAESFLKAASAQPGFGVQILKVGVPRGKPHGSGEGRGPLSRERARPRPAAPQLPRPRLPLAPTRRPCPAPRVHPQVVSLDSVQPEIRQQGAVQFKNHVKFRWAPRSGDAADGAMGDEEKEQVKAHITDLMLSAPPRVRSQLSEALTIISTHDFPHRWPQLLPQLLAKLASDDAAQLNGVLTTAHSIYQRYRGQFMTDQLSAELEYSQKLVRPLLAATQAAAARCTAAAAAAADDLPLLLANARLALGVFYSLNSPGLTEEFEDTLGAWMDCLHALLTLAAPSAASPDPEQEGPLDALKAAACECLSLFMERNEEEFAAYLQTFVRDVWTELTAVGPAPGQDNLAMAAIAFLTAVARSVHFALFADEGALRQVCEGIVVPNLRLRDEDEERFELDWVEYVRRDTEGGDADTRRRAASELVKALVDRFPAETTALFSGYVASLLAEAGAAPEAAWRAKDAAIYLVSALTARGKTAAAGATSTNQLVNLPDFYAAHVAPELAAAADPDARPVIKADCLRFATTFRSQLPRAAALDLFPRAAALLGSAHNVVHSYAAILVERLLAMRAGGAPAFTPAELGPHLQPMLERLFGALALPESGENEYVMRAVMQLVRFVGRDVAPAAPAALRRLADAMLVAARNPSNPGFNHYLFESVAALVRLGCAADPGAVAAYEALLFPPFQAVLQEDVQEFHPYVFQVLAQLVEARGRGGGPLPETYLALLPPLLAPAFWERQGNVPALVRLLRAYAAAAGGEVVARGLLPAALGVFQKLVASTAHDHEGLALLDALATWLDPGALAPYLSAVWTVLFQRLQAKRTPKFARCFVASAALMAAKHGGAYVADSMDGVQAGVAAMMLQSVWAPALAAPGPWDERRLGVGTARLLCEAAQVQGEGGAEAWAAALDALARRMGGGGAGSKEGSAEDEEGGAGEEEFAGYSAAFARLGNAAGEEVDPLAEVGDARADVARRLAAYAAAHPGRVPALVHARVSPEGQAALQQLLARAGVTLV